MPGLPTTQSLKQAFLKAMQKMLPDSRRNPYIPVMVRAPVITDVNSKEGLSPLLHLLQSLAWNNNTAVARAERMRLDGYLQAMSDYLGGEIEAVYPGTSSKKEEMTRLTTPWALSDIFEAMAKKIRNTILSDVVIAPSGISENKDVGRLFQGYEFSQTYIHNGNTFSFGFIQVKSAPGLRKFASIIPVFLLEQRMMEAVAPHEPEALLKGFQEIITLANHDMMHHFTLPAMNTRTVKEFISHADTPLFSWYESIPRTINAFSPSPLYEEWVQVAHEKTLLFNNDAVTADVCAKLDDYFAELKRIGQAIAIGDEIGHRQKAHETVDYFGTMMAHALTRVFPLNHPVMTHCLERLQDADPMPEKILVECHEMTVGTGPYSFDNKDEVIGRIAHHQPSEKTAKIIEAYQYLGLNLLRQDMGYRELKLLQLIKLSADDVQPHVPELRFNNINRVRDEIGPSMLKMIDTAAQTVGYKPR